MEKDSLSEHLIFERTLTQQPQESPPLQMQRGESHKSYKRDFIKAYLLLQGLTAIQLRYIPHCYLWEFMSENSMQATGNKLFFEERITLFILMYS